MERYYFDTDDGTELLRDTVGLECMDDEAARDEGARAIAEIARDYIPGGAPQKNISLWIRNARGETLLHMSVSFAIRSLQKAAP